MRKRFSILFLVLFLFACSQPVRYKIVKPQIPELKKYGRVQIPKTKWKPINYNGTLLYCTSKEELIKFMNAFIELKKAKKFCDTEIDKYNEFRKEYIKDVEVK